MLISHSKKFIFLHNYKVAGTSVREALTNYSSLSFKKSSAIDKLRFICGIYPRVYSDQFHHHTKAQDLKNKIPEKVFRNYFKFGFVRNPWDWQVSLYTYSLNLKTHHQHELIKSMKDFDAYIEWRVNNEVRLQKDFFYGPTGECLVDYIGKLENINEDFLSICKKINIQSSLPVLNESKRNSDYLGYYSQRSIDIVNEAFLKDIELFGYEKPKLS